MTLLETRGENIEKGFYNVRPVQSDEGQDGKLGLADIHTINIFISSMLLCFYDAFTS